MGIFVLVAAFPSLRLSIYTVIIKMNFCPISRSRCRSPKLIATIGFSLLLCLTFDQPFAAQNLNFGANGNKATEEPTPAPAKTPIPISNIISEADSVLSRLRVIGGRLGELSDPTSLEGRIAVIKDTIDAKEPGAQQTLSTNPGLDDLRAMEREWQELAGSFSPLKRLLREQISELDRYLDELGELDALWKLTAASIGPQAGTVADGNEAAAETQAAPAEVLQKTSSTQAAIADLKATVETRRSLLISSQAQLSELEARTTSVLDEVATLRENLLSNLFHRDSAPIWAPPQERSSLGGIFRQSIDTVNSQGVVLQAYAMSRTDRFVLHGGLFLLLAAALYWARRRVRPYVKKEPKLETASQIFEVPVATALVISVLFSTLLYPQAPRLLTALIGVAAIVPVVFLLRRLVDRSLFPILNILIALFFIDRLREILTAEPLASRLLFLGEMLGAMLFLAWFLRSEGLRHAVTAENSRVFGIIRRSVPIVMAIFGIAFVANAVGFVALGTLLGEGMLRSSYAALLIYTLTQIARSLLVFAMRVPPISKLSIVKNNRPVIRDKILRVVYFVGVIFWVLIALNMFSIRGLVLGIINSILAFSVSIGTIEVSVGDVVLFAITVWIALLVSRFIRFILEEDVYPRIDVADGTSYSISTVLHYGILVLGLLIAIAALGVDFTKFAIVAGAVGIGVGFGLQNIINNFVSGLILLFERPVKVGDTVQLGQHTGSLKRIGLRASILRKIDGSDVVVPNSRLISEEVVNWTMMDKQRRVEIPVGVAYGSDPEQVMQLLASVTAGKPDILAEPASRAFFLGFGDNSLDFELRFWTENTERLVALRSELVLEIYKVLTEANIEIPYPQRDLHLRSLDPEAAKHLSSMAQGDVKAG